MTEPTRLPPEALLFLCRRDFPQAGVGIAGRGSVALVRIVDGSGGDRCPAPIYGVELDWSAAKFDPQDRSIPDEVIGLDDLSDLHKGGFVLKLSNGERVSARSVVIASGARYRRPAIDGLEIVRGRERTLLGIATRGEAVRRAGGGLGGRWQFGGASSRLLGESSLQGLALGARAGPGGEHVALSRRPPSQGLSNVEVLTQTTVTGLEGRDGMLEAIPLRRGTAREEVRRHIQHLFLFIGAGPNTGWLSGSGVALDTKGFRHFHSELLRLVIRARHECHAVMPVGKPR